MSVFIKDMEKPKNCFGCDFNSSDCFCKINHGKIDRDFWDCDKPCPIIEVPAPHGNLIDIDSKITVAIKGGLKVTTVRELLNDRAVRLPKTVIEAEKSDV